MNQKLDRLFSGLMRQGGLQVTYASGQTKTYGPDPVTSAIRFTDAAAEDAVHSDPPLRLGEMYMQGRLRPEQGDIYDFVAAVRQNGRVNVLTTGAVLRHLWRSIAFSTQRATGLRAARRNIAHHYDLNTRMYRLFLDPDLNYSCAYFERDDQSLEEAQRAKQRHIAGKLLSREGGSAIDLGCGWGSMGLYLSQVCGLRVTGLTLSTEQQKIAAERSRELGANATFLLQDYRHARGSYDHVVSVGALEHIGVPQMKAFFGKVAELLDDDGTALIHSMCQKQPTPYAQPFGEKYIFPGGYIPAISEVIPAIEQAGLLVKDIEILPLHYAQTLRLWRERFMANREKVLELYDEQFLRMWEIYLAGAEGAFRFDQTFVAHFQLAKHQHRVPRRRGWLQPEKDRLRGAEVDYPIPG